MITDLWGLSYPARTPARAPGTLRRERPFRNQEESTLAGRSRSEPATRAGYDPARTTKPGAARDRGRPGRAPGAPGAPGLERGVGGGVSGQLQTVTILAGAGCVCARAPAVASDPGAPGAPGAGGVFWPPTAPFVPGATGAPTAFTPARPVVLGLALEELLT